MFKKIVLIIVALVIIGLVAGSLYFVKNNQKAVVKNNLSITQEGNLPQNAVLFYVLKTYKDGPDNFQIVRKEGSNASEEIASLTSESNYIDFKLSPEKNFILANDGIKLNSVDPKTKRINELYDSKSKIFDFAFSNQEKNRVLLVQYDQAKIDFVKINTISGQSERLNSLAVSSLDNLKILAWDQEKAIIDGLNSKTSVFAFNSGQVSNISQSESELNQNPKKWDIGIDFYQEGQVWQALKFKNEIIVKTQDNSEDGQVGYELFTIGSFYKTSTLQTSKEASKVLNMPSTMPYVFQDIIYVEKVPKPKSGDAALVFCQTTECGQAAYDSGKNVGTIHVEFFTPDTPPAGYKAIRLQNNILAFSGKNNHRLMIQHQRGYWLDFNDLEEKELINFANSIIESNQVFFK